MFTTRDEYWMQQALLQSERANEANEVPVGAVLVLNDEAIGYGYNCSISNKDPTSHAEVMAMRDGAERIRNYRLVNTTLYVTLEPCMMCVGAIVHARIKRLVYGAADPKTGAVESAGSFLRAGYHNHQVEQSGGLLAEPCGAILKAFFRERR